MGQRNFQAEHQELQRFLARELGDYGPPHPLEPKHADAVAWHLADVTVAVVIQAVREAEAPFKS